jgi:transposase-like protein
MQFLHKVPSGWQPLHCPNPKCGYHKPLQDGFPFKEDGTFVRKSDNRRIQRYLCLSCERSFSTQTFSVTYWLKNPELVQNVFMKTVGGMANRQIARDLGVNQGTVDRTISRIARHCFLFHTQAIKDAAPPQEIVVDGFVSFETSQFFPFHHHNAVEKETDFFIYFTDSEVRRSGVMTTMQKIRRDELEAMHGRPDSQAERKDMTELLQVTLAGQTSSVVHSDGHQSYPRAIRETNCDIRHVVTPGKNHRDRHNKLWSINLLDLLIRHSGANHKRETLAWSKRRQASAERLVVFLVWRNYMKVRREKKPRGPTPAMERGMSDHKLSVAEIFESRIFRDHVELPRRWDEYYDRKVATRCLAKNNAHELRYAR